MLVCRRVISRLGSPFVLAHSCAWRIHPFATGNACTGLTSGSIARWRRVRAWRCSPRVLVPPELRLLRLLRLVARSARPSWLPGADGAFAAAARLTAASAARNRRNRRNPETNSRRQNFMNRCNTLAFFFKDDVQFSTKSRRHPKIPKGDRA